MALLTSRTRLHCGRMITWRRLTLLLFMALVWQSGMVWKPPASAAPPPRPTGAEPPVVCLHDGDVNQDTHITPSDVVAVLRHFLGFTDPPLDACQELRANVDDPRGSTISPRDGLCIFRHFLGLPSCLSNMPPVADAGVDQTVIVGESIQLDGRATVDPDNGPLPLRFVWTLTTVPTGSTASLADSLTSTPTFIPDMLGTYVVTLVVDDGRIASLPDTVTIVAEPVRQPPLLEPIGNQQVALGSTLTLQLTAVDPDSDALTFTVLPLPLPPNATLHTASGLFTFRPDTAQVGPIDLTFTVSDGVLSSAETITITVDGAPPDGMTALTGRLLDTNDFVQGTETPIVGATVSLLRTSITAISDDAGRFTLTGLPAGRQVLDINTAAAAPGPDGVSYAGFREALTLFAGVTNVIERPLFLPRIDAASLTTIIPGAVTTVVNANLGITLTVPANAARNADGSFYTGALSISAVPEGLAPVALPVELDPALLITIQPVGVTFSTPVPITFPNVDNLTPGSEVDLWSLDPRSGTFTVVGTGRVSADGSIIETISGGVRAADWHAALPPAASGDDQSGGCDAQCCERACAGSVATVGAGNLEVEHFLVDYGTLGQPQSPRLVYNSSRAAPRPVIALDVTVPVRAAVPPQISIALKVAGIEQATQIFTHTEALAENQDETVRQVVQFDASGFPTDNYPSELTLTSHYQGSSVSSRIFVNVPVINEQQSLFGAGWTLDGLQRLQSQPGGSVQIIDGTGSALRFAPGGEDVAIVRNFRNIEIDVLQRYLSELGLRAVVLDQQGLTFEALSNFALIIWDDLSFAGGGVSASDVTIYQVAFEAGIPLYFIGDDLAHAAQCCLPEPQATQWEALLHLRRGGNFGGNGRLDITNPLHPVTNGPFGAVQSFTFTSDVDATTRTNTGEVLLAVSGNHDVVVAFEDPASGVRTVTQNVQAFDRLSPAGQIETEKLFKNAVRWLLDARMEDSNTFRSSFGDFSTVVKNPDNTFTRTLPNGLRVHFDVNGRQTAAVDRNGLTTTYEYDASGTLLAITDPLALVTTFTYNNGLLASISDPAGRVTRLEHDSNGNLRRLIDPDGTSRQFTYDAQHRMMSQTNKRGFLTTYEYDFTGAYRRSILPDGSTREVTPGILAGLFDPSSGVGNAENPAPVVRPGEVRAIYSDGNGHITTYSTDRLGTSTETTDPLGGVTSALRDGNGRILRRTFPSGNCVESAYDNQGNVIRETRMGATQCALAPGERDPLQVQTRTFTYESAFNQLASITDPAGNMTTFTYDDAGNVIQEMDALGNMTQRTYNERGQLLTRTDPLGNTISFAYDAVSNMITRTNTLENTWLWRFDAASNLIQTTNAAGHTYDFEYDVMGRLSRVSDAAGGRTAMTYDAAGNTATVTDPNGNTTAFAYDALNRLTRTTNALGQSRRYSYDTNGNVVAMIDPNGATITFTYDGLDRLVRKEMADNTVAYTYDTGGNLVRVVDDDSDVSFAYDAFSRLIETRTAAVAGSPETVMLYTYDASDNRLTMTDPQGGATSYTYDALNRLTALENPRHQVVQYVYDALSRRTQAILPNGTRTELSYDTANRLAQLSHRNDATTLFGFDFTYNGIDERTTLVDNDGPHVFAYDTLQRLVQAIHPTSSEEHFTYDAAGNRTSSHLSSSYTYDAANRLLEDDRFRYQYDANGNLIAQTERSGGAVTRYTYDGANQLTRIDLSDDGLVTYRYDGQGRRIEKNVNGIITRYVYDGDNILLELNASNAVIARYTHSPEIDEPVIVDQAGNSFFYHADALGSIVALTDMDGSVVQQYAYDTFGRLLAESGAIAQPYTYTGRESDGESGHYYYRARYYAPSSGRFLSEDPLYQSVGEGAEAQMTTAHLYLYTENNPINYTDPTGLQPTITVDASCNKGPFSAQDIRDAADEAFSAAVGTNCLRSDDLKRQVVDKFHNLKIKCDAKNPKCGYAKFLQSGNTVLLRASAPNAKKCGPLKSTILHEVVHRTHWRDGGSEKIAQSCEVSCFGSDPKVQSLYPNRCADDCR